MHEDFELDISIFTDATNHDRFIKIIEDNSYDRAFIFREPVNPRTTRKMSFLENTTQHRVKAEAAFE